MKSKTISLFCLCSLHLPQEEAAPMNQAAQGVFMRPILQSTGHDSIVLLNWDKIQTPVSHSSVPAEADFSLIKLQEIKPQM